MSETTIKELLEAGVHFGHQTSFWNPKMKPYIYGNRNHIHIIDIQKTVPMLNDACNFIEKIVSKGGNILFVGTKRAARDSIEKHATSCGMPYVSQRWLGGMLTNFSTVKQSIKRLKDLEIEVSKKDSDLTKKEQLMQQRELNKLNASLGGIKDMKKIPSALFVIDVGYENIAITEAKKLGIPVIAVVDTNNSFEEIDYFFPGNDDAIRAIDLYCSYISQAISKGLEYAKTNSPVSIEDELISASKSSDKDEKVSVKRKKKVIKAVKDNKTEDSADTKKKEVVKKAVTKKATVKKATTKKKVAKKTTSKKESE